MNKKTVSEVMRQMGKKGGKRRLETMTAQERKDIARQGGLASAERRKKKKG
jgi:hypothetical protein